MDRQHRYTEEQRTEAVALSTSVGVRRAALTLGYPVSTVRLWTLRPSSGPIIAAAERSIAERLVEAHKVALASVLDGLGDPKARLGDRAQALRVLGEQAALAEGRATSRSENFTVSVAVTADDLARQEEARRYARMLLERLDSGDVDGVERDMAKVLHYEREVQKRVTAGATPDEAERAIIEELPDG